MTRRLLGSIILLFAALGMAGFSSTTGASRAESSGNPWWIWLLIVLAFVAFLVVLFLWWRNGHQDEATAQAEPLTLESDVEAPGAAEQLSLDMATEDVPSPEAAPDMDAEPSQPVAAKADDLKRIEGIGPKISSILHAAGITTYAQLAETGPDAIREVLGEASPNLLRLANPDSWPEQAKLAAEGRWEALSELQDKLKGGRKT